ncbi:MAG: aldo/keto reductase [Acidobacteriota bacterium]
MSGNSPRPTDRRSFIATGLSCVAGATLLHSATQSEQMTGSEGTKGRKMISRTLGRTGISLPIVSIGAVSFDPGIYRRALDLGIRHFDTAPAYRNGNHETMLGEVLRGRPRDSFVIATSFGSEVYQDRRTRTFKEDAPVKALIESFEGSLRRLKLDYIDIYYLAWACSKETTLYRPYIDAIMKLKDQGKTRFIGVTTHENEPEVLRAAAGTTLIDVVLTVYNFRQTYREEMKKAIANAAKADVGIVAMKTQAGASWDEESARIVNMRAALKWVLSDENVHTAVPGIATYDQLEADFRVMENLALTAAEEEDLERALRVPYRTFSLFCQNCRECVAQCPHRLDIPALMRGYMYARGYKDPGKAKEALRRARITRVPCGECGQCHVTCAMGFDVRSRARDIAALIDVPDTVVA